SSDLARPSRTIAGAGDPVFGARRHLPADDRAGHSDRSNSLGGIHYRDGDRTISGIPNLPHGRAGQLLALAILCLVLAGIYLLMIAPVLDMYAQREAMLADRQILLPRLSAAAEQLPSLRARLA